MVGFIYRKCFAVLRSKPLRLWGLSMLASLLSSLAVFFGLLPIIVVPIILVLSAGMALVYLDGYRGKEISAAQIFDGFKKFAHVAGGMAWMSLWILLWGLIPIAGIVFALIKVYEYRFTPYLLMTKPEIPAVDAIKESKKLTYGIKGKMFLADFLFGLILGGCSLVLVALSFIPYVGIVFRILLAVYYVLAVLFAPLFCGLLSASFYEEAPNIAQQSVMRGAAKMPCAICGTPLEIGARFCPGCGNPVQQGQPPVYAPPPNANPQ